METTKNLEEILKIEKKKFESATPNLGEIIKKFSEMGIDTKTNYSFPLKDTIGRVISNDFKSKSQL